MVGEVREPRGLWFEELEVGVTYLHRPHRTVTEADNVIFSTLTMNTQSLHLDDVYAKETEFGARLVNSMFTLSTIVGLSVASISDRTLVANLGFTDVRFPNPVLVGDTLSASTVVIDKRFSGSRPGQGIVELEHHGHNQNGAPVCVARRMSLFHLRPDVELLG